MAEAGVPGLRLQHLERAEAPPKTPAAIVAKLNQAINEVLKPPGNRRTPAQHEHDPGGRHAGRDRAFIAEETARWADVIRAAKITAD